jgi:transcriptional regulator with XRE-family HTH domain
MDSTTVGAFLKSLRLRIDRSAESLGTYRRLPSRRGRVASQEEIAEALNVSRGWYGLLESGAKIRASTRLLARIADVLMLSGEERTELFRLAVPEVSVPSLPPAPAGVVEALQSVRNVARGVLNARSETEVLSVLTQAAGYVPRPETFSDVDRALLNTFSHLASLTLSSR